MTDFPEVDIAELINKNNIPNYIINLSTLDGSALGNFPTFKNLVENLPPFINNHPNVLKALEYTTGFSPKKIRELMQPGKGTKVVVVNNLTDSFGRAVNEMFDPKTLHIDKDYVFGLNSTNTPARYQAIGLMLTLTVLHEFVHFGRDANGEIADLKAVPREAGWYFVDSLNPNGVGRIDPNNAKEWLKYYNLEPKNNIMLKILFSALLIILINTSCVNIEKKKLDGKDSSEIIKAILTSDKVKILSKGIDTLFIIKSSVVNKSWPSHISTFKIFYIIEEKDVSIIDFSPNNYFDYRFKIAVPIFEIDKQIANILLIIYYNKENYALKFKLKYIRKKWVII